jgi:multiple sugar transport system permease protein
LYQSKQKGAMKIKQSVSFKKILQSDFIQALLFLLPAIIILFTFNYYPIYSIFKLSFFRWENFAPERTFVGLENYRNLLDTPRFWNALKVTFIYTSAVTIGSIIIGLVLAVILNKKTLILKSFWRSVFFLPIVTPTVAAAMAWRLLFNPNIGYVNKLLEYFHISGPNWLADTTWALPTIILLGIWKRIGFNLVIYLAALQSIPTVYYESAMVDGANAVKKFWYITIPILKPTTIMLFILSIIDSFLVFDQVIVLTRGGPVNATEVIGWYMYNNAFTFQRMGYGSAISVVIFIIIAGLTIIQWRFVGFGEFNES